MLTQTVFLLHKEHSAKYGTAIESRLPFLLLYILTFIFMHINIIHTLSEPFLGPWPSSAPSADFPSFHCPPPTALSDHVN